MYKHLMFCRFVSSAHVNPITKREGDLQYRIVVLPLLSADENVIIGALLPATAHVPLAEVFLRLVHSPTTVSFAIAAHQTDYCSFG